MSRRERVLSRALAALASIASIASIGVLGALFLEPSTSRTSSRAGGVVEWPAGFASDATIAPFATPPIVQGASLRGSGAADAASVSIERVARDERVDEVRVRDATSIPVPTDPERRSDGGPAARLRELLGVASGSVAASELDRLLDEQLRDARELVVEGSGRAEAVRAPYNTAVHARVERLVRWFGEDGARRTLERTPFHLAEADGRLTRLALVDGHAARMPEADEPIFR